MRSIPRRANSKRPEPRRRPQPHLPRGRRGVGTQCTGPRTKGDDHNSAREDYTDVLHERLAAAVCTVCAALVVTSHSFDSWRTRMTSLSASMPRRHRRFAVRAFRTEADRYATEPAPATSCHIAILSPKLTRHFRTICILTIL